MNKFIATFLLAICSLRPLGAFDVTVKGLYFEPGATPPPYAITSLSGDTVGATSAVPWADWVPIPPFDEVDGEGNPITYYGMVAGTEQTVFSFNLTGDWGGRQVCLSGPEGQTNFVHFYFGGLGFNAADFSGNPSAPPPSVTMLGNYFTIGQLTNGAAEQYPPYVVGTSSAGNPAWPDTTIDFVATRSRSLWRWSHLVSATDPGMVTAMTFEADHKLRLHPLGSGPSGGILLDPTNEVIKISGSPVLTTVSASAQFVGKTAAGVNLAMNGTLSTAAGRPPQIILGSYNETRVDGVLIVGNGSGSGTVPRQNGLRILDDGTVLILPKGDLLMDFDEGEVP